MFIPPLERDGIYAAANHFVSGVRRLVWKRSHCGSDRLVAHLAEQNPVKNHAVSCLLKYTFAKRQFQNNHINFVALNHGHAKAKSSVNTLILDILITSEIIVK